MRVTPQHAVDEHQPLRGAANVRTRETGCELLRAIQLIADGNQEVFDTLNFDLSNRYRVDSNTPKTSLPLPRRSSLRSRKGRGGTMKKGSQRTCEAF